MYLAAYFMQVTLHTDTLRFIALCCTSQILRILGFFLQIEVKTLYQQIDYDSLDCDTSFIAVIWNRTHSISKVYLYLTSFNPNSPVW